MQLSHDIYVVEAHYGSAVAAYFRFARWNIVNCMLVSLVALSYTVKHLVFLKSLAGGSGATNVARSWVGQLPWALQYSSYTPAEAFDFCALLVVCNCLLLLVTLRKVGGSVRGTVSADRCQCTRIFTMTQRSHCHTARSLPTALSLPRRVRVRSRAGFCGLRVRPHLPLAVGRASILRQVVHSLTARVCFHGWLTCVCPHCVSATCLYCATRHLRSG